jgi:O-antigen/teichoic acid export membrane protein
VVGAGLFLLAPLLARWWDNPQLVAAGRVVALALPLSALGHVSRAGLRAFRDVRVAETIEQIGIPLATAVVVVALHRTVDHGALLGVIAAAGSTAAAGALSWALLRLRFRNQPPPAYAPGRWCAYSVPAWIEAGVLLLVGRAGYLFLAGSVDTRAVGIYGAALSLAALVGLPLAALNTIFGPSIAHHFARGEHARVQELYARLTWMLLVLGIAGVTVVAAAAGPLLGAFGPEFAHDRGPLLVLLGWQLVNLGTGPTGPLLVMSGRMGWKLVNAAAALVLTLSLSWLLVPRLGPLGAAMALAVATSIVNVVQVVEVRLLLGLWAYDLSVLSPRHRASPGSPGAPRAPTGTPPDREPTPIS